jgi:hypothetical protein
MKPLLTIVRSAPSMRMLEPQGAIPVVTSSQLPFAPEPSRVKAAWLRAFVAPGPKLGRASSGPGGRRR